MCGWTLCVPPPLHVINSSCTVDSDNFFFVCSHHFFIFLGVDKSGVQRRRTTTTTKRKKEDNFKIVKRLDSRLTAVDVDCCTQTGSDKSLSVFNRRKTTPYVNSIPES